MTVIPLLIALGIGYRFLKKGSDLGCYDIDTLCWYDDKAPESCAELAAVRVRAHEGSMAYRLDPVKTAASYLNRVFILDPYRARPFYAEKVKTVRGKTYVLASFDDNSHMAFELYQPCVDCQRDIYLVSRYAYVD